jgi:CRP-like cAMP-binding protein
MFLPSVSGREATLCYAAAGAILGEGIFYATAKGTLEAMEASTVFDLPAADVRAISESEPQFKLPLLHNLEDVISLIVGEVSAHAFGDLRSRLARHLLALAEVSTTSRRPEVRITRAELALAVASTTDAVTRAVRGMAREGLIRVGRGRVQLADPVRLLSIASHL